MSGRSRERVRRAGVIVALLAGMFAAAPPTRAEELFCLDCQAKRWRSLETQLLKRAGNLKSARELLRQAEKGDDADLLAKARALVARTTKEWEYVDALARQLGSPSYTAYLARHQVDVEQRFDSARAALERRTEQFDRLRGALGEQNAAVLRDMEGIIRQEARERRGLAVDSSFGALKGAADLAEHQLELLRALPAGQAPPAAIRNLEHFVKVATTLKGGRIGYEVAEKEYLPAAAASGQMLLSLAIPRMLTPEKAGPMAARAAAWPFFLTIALDLAQIGLSHEEFREAQQRLDDVRNVELAWQTEIQGLGARVNTLRAERDLAADAIRRHGVFEQQVATVRAGMAQ